MPRPGSKRQRVAERREVRQSLPRGFTLVELLVVVAMVGILAALAVAGYKRYVASAGTAEAMAMIQLIRHGETQYKVDAFQYLGCSGCGAAGCPPGGGSLTTYYPMTTPSHQKYSWEQKGHPDHDCWQQLNVRSDGALRFGYAVVAGNSTDSVLQPQGFTNLKPLQQPTEPWFVIQAAGDRDDDGTQALVAATSWTNEVYIENDTE